jgi:hypothetical protein
MKMLMQLFMCMVQNKQEIQSHAINVINNSEDLKFISDHEKNTNIIIKTLITNVNMLREYHDKQ